MVMPDLGGHFERAGRFGIAKPTNRSAAIEVDGLCGQVTARTVC